MGQPSPEARALRQLVDTLYKELEESCWFENHAYTIIEQLEGVAYGQDLQTCLQRMVATTERAVEGARGLVRLKNGSRLESSAGASIS